MINRGVAEPAREENEQNQDCSEGSADQTKERRPETFSGARVFRFLGRPPHDEYIDDIAFLKREILYRNPSPGVDDGVPVLHIYNERFVFFN